ncbi:MAG: hypothetical protein QOI41_4961 [Myxococcales bacterium]|jgi:hypothetical protein|nr:hypothetical protein [Myxococcales bacterium]
MDRTLVDALERLCREAGFGEEPTVAREAARATGGLPVLSDMGGVLVVTVQGGVLHYDPERGEAVSVADERWRKAALVNAARKHGELRSLFPGKPKGAILCAQCAGTGKLVRDLHCAECMGTGWLDPPSLDPGP